MKRSIFSFFILIFIPSIISTKTIWRERNIYLSSGRLSVGDILVVNVDDISKLKFSIAQINDNSLNISSNPDVNITGFLPRVSSDKRISRNDKTNITGSSNFRISIASRITKVIKGGKLNISGSKEYSYNGVTNRFKVSGIIDPVYIKGRIIQARDIADFRFEIRGIKESTGIGMKMSEEEEKEEGVITIPDEEKQRIIRDYFNKMIRELTR